MAISEKTWWAPVWRGLVVDPNGKHFRQLKGAVWLLLYLILHADRRSGRLVRKQGTISRDMDVSPWTIRAWMRRLHRHGYIQLTTTGRAMEIEVLRWRAVGQSTAAQTGSGVPHRGARTHRARDGARPGALVPYGETEAAPLPNESLLTRGFLREGNGTENFSSLKGRARRSKQMTRTELLARDLAEGLQDGVHLARYRAYADRHSETVLRRCLSEARSMPSSRITRSRAALFEALLRKHVEHLNEDSRR